MTGLASTGLASTGLASTGLRTTVLARLHFHHGVGSIHESVGFDRILARVDRLRILYINRSVGADLGTRIRGAFSASHDEGDRPEQPPESP
jgi:hypothetical protein